MIIYPKTLSYVDVIAAVQLSDDRDLVKLPSGTATWKMQLSTEKDIEIQGHIGEGEPTVLINASGRARLIKGPNLDLHNVVIRLPE